MTGDLGGPRPQLSGDLPRAAGKRHQPRGVGDYRHGSVWHSEDVPHEAYGIWGQTFAGWVDPERGLQVLFPSRNEAGNGTINLASQPWSKPLRERASSQRPRRTEPDAVASELCGFYAQRIAACARYRADSLELSGAAGS